MASVCADLLVVCNWSKKAASWKLLFLTNRWPCWDLCKFLHMLT